MWVKMAAWACVVFAVAVALPLYFAVQVKRQQKADFMESCLQHRVFYECMYLWRSSANQSSEGPVIVPVHVPAVR